MARTPARTPLRRRRGLAAVAALAAGAALALGPAVVAGAEEAPAGTAPPAVHDVLEGTVPGLAATASWHSGLDDMQVRLVVTNDTGAPQQVAVPFGALFATDDEGDQTLATSGPDDGSVVEVAAAGGTPVLDVPPGRSTHLLRAFCSEAEDGAPGDRAPMTSLGTATDPLTVVLRNIAAQEADGYRAQEAVWWVTDYPVLPVPDDIAPLLEGVDVEAFAAAPHRVVPDTGYDPAWTRAAGPDAADEPGGVTDERAAGILDEAFDGGSPTGGSTEGSPGPSGPGIALWVLVVGAGVTALIVVAARQSARAREAQAATAVGAPGWYPDPAGPGHVRWWDGRAWTGHRR